MSDDLISRDAAKALFVRMQHKSLWSPHDVHFSTLDVVDNLDAVPAVEPEGIWTDIVCEIQRKAVDDGGCHVGDAVDWCIFGRELKSAIYELFGEDSQQ